MHWAGSPWRVSISQIMAVLYLVLQKMSTRSRFSFFRMATRSKKRLRPVVQQQYWVMRGRLSSTGRTVISSASRW